MNLLNNFFYANNNQQLTGFATGHVIARYDPVNGITGLGWLIDLFNTPQAANYAIITSFYGICAHLLRTYRRR